MDFDLLLMALEDRNYMRNSGFCQPEGVEGLTAWITAAREFSIKGSKYVVGEDLARFSERMFQLQLYGHYDQYWESDDEREDLRNDLEDACEKLPDQPGSYESTDDEEYDLNRPEDSRSEQSGDSDSMSVDVENESLDGDDMQVDS
ncbi:hypothetical protein BJ508DRAFT_334255 [Ascobolus immersus RN42]|uniref:Uncharacterized protein n=1 Tax=Ascobolus immersus RN42 TaxID=1160509 RepID=A0A3N4HGR3_ASCIM|nr:hypothetical protein BJ508DRAFT_334255 [Ascobolus immersus RN42]